MEVTSLPAGELWPQIWCAARPHPKGSHTKPGNKAKGCVTGVASVSALIWNHLLRSTLTGNLLNRSVNICVVRGLLRLLMKEFRASLKTLVTRCTSKLPVNLNCVGKHQGLVLRPQHIGQVARFNVRPKWAFGLQHWLQSLAAHLGSQQVALLLALLPHTEMHWKPHDNNRSHYFANKTQLICS